LKACGRAEFGGFGVGDNDYWAADVEAPPARVPVAHKTSPPAGDQGRCDALLDAEGSCEARLIEGSGLNTYQGVIPALSVHEVQHRFQIETCDRVACTLMHDATSGEVPMCAIIRGRALGGIRTHITIVLSAPLPTQVIAENGTVTPTARGLLEADGMLLVRKPMMQFTPCRLATVQRETSNMCTYQLQGVMMLRLWHGTHGMAHAMVFRAEQCDSKHDAMCNMSQ
jgi:hypothetical protein